ISEIQLFLDRERPEHAVDRVARMRIEVVQHQQMHAEVVEEKRCELNFTMRNGDDQEERERDEVRRVKAAQTSFPEWTEANVRFDARSSRFGPLQMNAKTGNDEEQENADVAKRADELERSDGISEQVLRKPFIALFDCVIEDDA